MVHGGCDMRSPARRRRCRFLRLPVKRSRAIAHYAGSWALPNSNAPVLTNGGTVVPGASRGVTGRETRGGTLQGELCSPRVRQCSATLTRGRPAEKTNMPVFTSFHTETETPKQVLLRTRENLCP